MMMIAFPSVHTLAPFWHTALCRQLSQTPCLCDNISAEEERHSGKSPGYENKRQFLTAEGVFTL